MTGYISVNNVNELCVLDKGGKDLQVKVVGKGVSLCYSAVSRPSK